MCVVMVIRYLGENYSETNIDKPEILRHIIVSALRRLSWFFLPVVYYE
jgi:hypothetical protein